MRGGISAIILELLVAMVFYFAMPAGFVWGWVKWATRKQTLAVAAFLSLVGFTFATASALLAASSVLYAQAMGGFAFYDPLLITIFRWGVLLSLSGTLFGLMGIWRPGPLRWFAPTCSIGILLFWLAAAMAE
jgi:hypothetical protein